MSWSCRRRSRLYASAILSKVSTTFGLSSASMVASESKFSLGGRGLTALTDLHPGAERAHGRKLLDGNNPFHNATQSGYAAAQWLGSTWQVQIGFGKPWNRADTS